MANAPQLRAPSDETDRDPAGDGDDARMPFLSHLGELRIRLRNSVLGLLAGTAVAFLFRFPLYSLLTRPLDTAWMLVPKSAGLPPHPEIVFTSPLDSFMVPFKLSLLAGVFLASPVIFHQLWRFISPGLYSHERRVVLPLIFFSVLLFVGGAAFCFELVLPKSYAVFLSYSSDSTGALNDVLGRQELFGHKIEALSHTFTLKPMITMDEYFSLTSTLLLLFGAVFELPLVLSVLAMLGIVTPRGLWRFNRYFILIAFVASAFLTPGDLVIGQVAMGGALTLLYNLSILIALLVGRPRREETATPAG